MKITEKCFECLLTRIEYECRLVCSDEKKIAEIVKICHQNLSDSISENSPSPEISSRIHRIACEMVGSPDPYSKIKKRTNEEAEIILNQVEDKLTTFKGCALASVIANTLDYGSKEHKVTNDFVSFFSDEFKKGLSIDDTHEIEKLCKRVVYLCDNCGEIVFDRKLIEYLKENGSYVTVVVKSKPIINDATIEDAISLGIDKIADNVYESTDGISELGINLNIISQKVKEAIDSATIIISKGMANYESLSEYKKTVKLPPVAYLMMVKCEPIADNIQIPKGSRIAYLAH
ncbi:MAG: DUF89 family protein [Methanomicrobiaceae archaeon]|nr:DUF89 family protein [Methanomicrobiaceae archaeon]